MANFAIGHTNVDSGDAFGGNVRLGSGGGQRERAMAATVRMDARTNLVECPRLLVPVEFGHLCVVLVATRTPLNLGAAARAMSNFGFPRLRVVNPYAAAFSEARSAVGAA